jgi:signal transduction histidine kinase
VRWWRGLTLRGRLIIIGTAGLALGFALGAVALVGALGVALRSNVDNEALHTADQVAALVNAGALPNPLPVAGAEVVQVVDAQSRVRAASIGADHLVPILTATELAAGRAGARLDLDGARAGLNDPIRVVVVPAGSREDPQSVLVAVPVGEVRESLRLLGVTLLVIYPVLVLGMAVMAWRVVGATLRPVEELRRGAASITDRAGADRLPVPPGQDEIARLAATLNDMLARLEAGRLRQRAFVADAAHELRSPLANMRTSLEVGSALGERTDWNEVAADLLADTERLSRLVDDLLLLARTEHDDSNDRGRAVAVDLSALAAGVAVRYRTARVPVTAASDAPHWSVQNPDAVERVVANLVDNAVRHAETAVQVDVAAEESDVVITVADDGPGIPVADRDRVFDRFARLDGARDRHQGGTGLGLAIVRELVRLGGGTVVLLDGHPGLRAQVRLPAGGAAVLAAADGDG